MAPCHSCSNINFDVSPYCTWFQDPGQPLFIEMSLYMLVLVTMYSFCHHTWPSMTPTCSLWKLRLNFRGHPDSFADWNLTLYPKMRLKPYSLILKWTGQQNCFQCSFLSQISSTNWYCMIAVHLIFFYSRNGQHGYNENYSVLWEFDAINNEYL